MPTEEQTYREGIKNDLADIKRMVSYTNGKVRRITIALVLLGGIVLGQAFQIKDLAPVLFHLLL